MTATETREGAEAPANTRVYSHYSKVKLSADPERTVEIPITTTLQDRATAADFSGVPATVKFNRGDTEKTFNFAATADGLGDDGEKVKLTFGTMPDGVTEGTTEETVVSVTDDDLPAVTVNFGAATYPVNEGASVTVTVALSAAP